MSKRDNLRWSKAALDQGFIQIPNLLLDYHEQLGIDEKELIFLIKISRHKEDFKIHDNQLVTGSQKTAQRRRSSLKKKNLLSWVQHKESFNLNGEICWKTTGFSYDLSYVNYKLQELKAKDEKVEEIVEEEEIIDNIQTDKIVRSGDKIGNTAGQERPAYNTNYNTIYNTSSRDTTTKFKELKTPKQVKVNTTILDKEIISAYKSSVDSLYIPNTADLRALTSFEYKDHLLKYIPYWCAYIGTDENYLYRGNTLDTFNKNNTAQIYVMIKQWSKFNKFAQNKIDSKKLQDSIDWSV